MVATLTRWKVLQGGVFITVWREGTPAEYASDLTLAGVTDVPADEVGAADSPVKLGRWAAYIVDTSGGDVTLELPSSSISEGYAVVFLKTSAANTLTVAATGADTVDGGASVTATALNESLEIYNPSGTAFEFVPDQQNLWDGDTLFTIGPTNLTTNPGELLFPDGQGGFTVLVPGADDQYLASDSGAAAGVSWKDLPAADGTVSTFSVYDATGGSSFTATAGTVVYDTVRTDEGGDWTLQAGGILQCATADTYIVQFDVGMDQTGGNSRSSARAYLELQPSGGSWAELPGTTGLFYSRQTTNGENSCSIHLTRAFAVGDQLRARCVRIYGSGMLATLANASRATVTRLKGPKGDTGPAGADGDLKWQGAWTATNFLANDVVQYQGSAYVAAASVTGSDVPGVSASWELLASKGDQGAPATGGYGSDYTYGESLGQSSTSSTSYQEKLELNMTATTAGRYRIGWSFVWRLSSTSRSFSARVQVDNATDVGTIFVEPFEDDSDERVPAAGFAEVTLSQGAHQVDIDYRAASSGATAYIWDARVEVWRVGD